MAAPADQDQKWLIDCLSVTLDTSRDVRTFAETSLQQASLQPDRTRRKLEEVNAAPPMAAQTANPLEPESNRSPTTPPPETGFGPELDRSRFRTITVYCGSSPGRKASYQEAAVELGREPVERRIDLVYGGGSVGLMGACGSGCA